MKRSPAETYGRPHLTPIAVFAGAFRRAWVRITELGHGERHALEHAMNFSGDLDILLVQHDVRHARRMDGSQRVFKAPDLVYSPPVHRLPVRGSHSVVIPLSGASKARHHSR